MTREISAVDAQPIVGAVAKAKLLLGEVRTEHPEAVVTPIRPPEPDSRIKLSGTSNLYADPDRDLEINTHIEATVHGRVAGVSVKEVRGQLVRVATVEVLDFEITNL